MGTLGVFLKHIYTFKSRFTEVQLNRGEQLHALWSKYLVFKSCSSLTFEIARCVRERCVSVHSAENLHVGYIPAYACGLPVMDWCPIKAGISDSHLQLETGLISVL